MVVGVEGAGEGREGGADLWFSRNLRKRKLKLINVTMGNLLFPTERY